MSSIGVVEDDNGLVVVGVGVVDGVVGVDVMQRAMRWWRTS